MSLRVIVVGWALLTLTGCHLFEDLQIDCVAGMACAGGGDTGDTGDTSATIGPSMGWIVSRAQDKDGHAEAFSADESLIQSWSGLAALLPDDGSSDPRYGASVAFNPATGAGAIALGSSFAALGADGDSARTASYVDTTIYDIEVATGRAWLATGTDVLAYDYTAREEPTTSLFGGTLVAATGIALAGDSLYVADCGDGKPDLYTLDAATGRVTSELPDFTADCGGGGNVFIGPDGEPWHCGQAGGLYRVADLVGGATEATIQVENFADVRDCGFDPADGSFLLFDATRGLFRLDTEGILTGLWSPPAGGTALRGNFFPAG